MSAVAQIMRQQGQEVSGSDLYDSTIVAQLKESGMNVFLQHLADHIDESIDLLIFSEAIPETNAERVRARGLDIPSISYAEALGLLSREKKTIAVAGTHGKTTVTGMLTSILLQTELDPTVVIGSTLDLLEGRNYRVGDGEWFLTEACEYRGNFLSLSPFIVLINNLEPDHLDFFQSEEAYFACFQELIEKIPADGYLVLFEHAVDHLDLHQVKGQVLVLVDEPLPHFPLQLPGRHNQHNAYAAQAVAGLLNVSEGVIRAGLSTYRGTWRRFEFKGRLHGAHLYDDYGHHPTEIVATLQAARERYPDAHLTVIFQPHQYSRTRAFFDDFAVSFSGADEVWITDIYRTRDSEEDVKAVSSERLVEAVREHQPVRYLTQTDLATALTSHAQENQVYLVMGAGDINQLFQDLELDQKPC